jgi:hypothetical protein
MCVPVSVSPVGTYRQPPSLEEVLFWSSWAHVTLKSPLDATQSRPDVDLGQVPVPPERTAAGPPPPSLRRGVPSTRLDINTFLRVCSSLGHGQDIRLQSLTGGGWLLLRHMLHFTYNFMSLSTYYLLHIGFVLPIHIYDSDRVVLHPLTLYRLILYISFSVHWRYA